MRVSRNQKRAVYRDKRLVFVPYEILRMRPVFPRGCHSWCGKCAFSWGNSSCPLPMTLTKCRGSYRRDSVHGYWKEVPE